MWSSLTDGRVNESKGSDETKLLSVIYLKGLCESHQPEMRHVLQALQGTDFFLPHTNIIIRSEIKCSVDFNIELCKSCWESRFLENV